MHTFTIAFILLVLGLFTLLQATRRRKATGLPGGEIIYADTSQWDPLEKPLYDAHVGLAGKPDYLVRQGEMIIPVEVKSTRSAQTPYDSHIYQLAAYCRLVETEYQVRPAYGILHYPNHTFRIEYTLELERKMLDLLDEMRSQATRKQVQRSHQAPQRCRRCGYRPSCDQRLA
jgi:CRISPR-associated exonuclease Cas4